MVYPINYELIEMGEFAGYLVAMHEDSINEDMPFDTFNYYSVSENITERAYGLEGAVIYEYIYGLLVDS